MLDELISPTSASFLNIHEGLYNGISYIKLYQASLLSKRNLESTPKLYQFHSNKPLEISYLKTTRLGGGKRSSNNHILCRKGHHSANLYACIQKGRWGTLKLPRNVILTSNDMAVSEEKLPTLISVKTDKNVRGGQKAVGRIIKYDEIWKMKFDMSLSQS